MADIEADVIIVGSGISGALLAAKLAAAGVKVAILEAGAAVDRGDGGRSATGTPPIKVPECPYPPTPQAEHPISNDLGLLVPAGRARTNSRAPTSRWSAARPGIGSAPACASCRTTFG